MKEPQNIVDYRRIDLALRYIDSHVREQPTLEVVAEAVGMSPFHFQKLFSRWAGISPKKFLQAISAERARAVLTTSTSTLEAAWKTGLSGTGRLHDLIVSVDAVAPGAFGKGGSGLCIYWGIGTSPFGYCFVGLTDRGICRLEFHDGADPNGGVARLRSDWPEASFERDDAKVEAVLEQVFGAAVVPGARLSLLVRGTNFQIQVWRALIAIPEGRLTTYGDIAHAIDRDGANRAVGSAVGKNPISYLIPCHRVIRKIGETGGYRWGQERKRVLLARELGDAGWSSINPTIPRNLNP